MALARLCVKVGKRGASAHHASYVTRTGAYERRLEKGERLLASESGNMPSWAAHDAVSFWIAADTHERANGAAYREFEIALPRELGDFERIALVRDFVGHELGETHAYTWAIHSPKAIDGAEQPHAHIMFSERQRDGIERDPQDYFKRYNAKNPERGGARKGYGETALKSLPTGARLSERKAELVALRHRWEQMCNARLERSGQSARIDMRSYADQGIDLAVEKKQLPSQWRNPEQRARVLALRAAKAEQSEARAELAGIDIDGMLVRLAHQDIEAATAFLSEPEPEAAPVAVPKRPTASPYAVLVPHKETVDAAAIARGVKALQRVTGSGPSSPVVPEKLRSVTRIPPARVREARPVAPVPAPARATPIIEPFDPIATAKGKPRSKPFQRVASTLIHAMQTGDQLLTRTAVDLMTALGRLWGNSQFSTTGAATALGERILAWAKANKDRLRDLPPELTQAEAEDALKKTLHQIRAKDGPGRGR